MSAAALCIAAGALPLGCITAKPWSKPPSGTGAQVLQGMPLARFEADRCAAGALDAVLAYFGRPTTVVALDAELPQLPGGGVLSLDLLLAARRHGLTANWVQGDAALVAAEIDAARPVILMLRLLDAPGDGGDVHHFVVVDGHDAASARVRLQFGDGKARWATLRRIDRAWRATDRASLVFREASSDALGQAAALEAEGESDRALSLYRAYLAERPDSVRGWTDLGNALRAAGEPAEAERAYRRALALDVEDVDAANNLAWLLYEVRGDLDEAEQLAREAAGRSGPEQDLALDTLGRILLARGDCAGAAVAFRRALELVPAQREGARPQLVEALAQSESCGVETGEPLAR